MRIFACKEQLTGERRAPVTPTSVAKLIRLGAKVEVEEGMGTSIFFRDADYETAGAQIGRDREQSLREADLVLRVRKPTIEEAELLVERWRVAVSQGHSVDLYPEMVGITSRIIGRILFGADVSRALPELTRFSIVNEELLRRAVSPHPMPRWLPTSHNIRLTRELAQVRGIVDEIISIRQSEPAKGSADDMLGRLLAARDAENAADRLNETEVSSQVLLFLIAGLRRRQ